MRPKPSITSDQHKDGGNNKRVCMRNQDVPIFEADPPVVRNKATKSITNIDQKVDLFTEEISSCLINRSDKVSSSLVPSTNSITEAKPTDMASSSSTIALQNKPAPIFPDPSDLRSKANLKTVQKTHVMQLMKRIIKPNMVTHQLTNRCH